MKTYALYPGCSLEKLGLGYYHSVIESMRALGIELKELEDWNCCGSTAYFHVDELLAYTFCARNLAIAEKDDLDVVAPCAACYKNLYFTNVDLQNDPDLAEHINYALEEDDLHFSGKIKVRHPLELIALDFGPEEIKSKVKNPLEGLRVIPYYGCQVVRPQKKDEDVEQPMYFEDMLSAIGATPVDYPDKLRCCGGSLLITNRFAALSLVHDLLRSSEECDGAVIATTCPMCQVNLECYQHQVNQEFGTKFSMPVMYFTQLLGLALGIPPKPLGIGTEIVSTTAISSYAEKLAQDAS
jgi:heterodisulfide reductase subunit B